MISGLLENSNKSIIILLVLIEIIKKETKERKENLLNQNMIKTSKKLK